MIHEMVVVQGRASSVIGTLTASHDDSEMFSMMDCEDMKERSMYIPHLIHPGQRLYHQSPLTPVRESRLTRHAGKWCTL